VTCRSVASGETAGENSDPRNDPTACWRLPLQRPGDGRHADRRQDSQRERSGRICFRPSAQVLPVMLAVLQLQSKFTQTVHQHVSY